MRSPPPVAVFLLCSTVALAGCADFVRTRIYRPDPLAGAPAWSGRAPRLVATSGAEGPVLRGWWWPPLDDRDDVTVFFPGSGGNRDAAAVMAEPLSRGGHGVLVASWRGYGDNPGRPTEAGLQRDGAAWTALARELHPKGRLFLFGFSLGASVALRQGARGDVDAVTTLGAFARLADAAPALARPFLPDRFDNVAAIRRISAPVFLMHGTADDVVPFADMETLRAGARGPVQVVTLRGGGHRVDLAQVTRRLWPALDAAAPPRREP